MEFFQISFAKVYLLAADLGEIVVDEGVDISVAMVDEIHQCFNAIFSGSFSLLVNKRNSYSTELEALIKFGTHTGIDKIAVFAPNKLAKLSADFAADIPSSEQLNILVFTSREEALAWLTQ
ncbi:MAG: STAS/SEC14 domain-containing protein [Litorilituus sp.]|jgi:hypothetical protein|nr:STAS/SEC14 domain-containing protein [Litorilituus sp.]